MKILIIHGPNLNLLGSREPEKYGKLSSDEIINVLRKEFIDHEFVYFQSNSEGKIIDQIQQSQASNHGILINAGGFSHTSVAIADAIRSIVIPTISLHITNPTRRESYRHKDIVGEACFGTIAGLGTQGYSLAIECLLEKLLEKKEL